MRTRFGIALAALALWAGPSPAAVKLRPAVAELAGELHKFLQGQGDSAVAVGQIADPPTFPASGGPGVALMLTEELKKLGVTVKARAKLGIKGEYGFAETPADAENEQGAKLLAVKITVTVVDQFGATLVKIPYERKVDDEADVAHLTGLPVALPTGEGVSRGERDAKLREARREPKVEVKGSRVATEDPRYAVEILVDGHACPATTQEGLAYVPVGRGQTYAVRLINDGEYDAAVRLTIDGLSVFAFSELRHAHGPEAGQPLYSVYLVPARGSLLVEGWHVSNHRADKFLVAEFAKSAAAELLRSSKERGTITATFSAAWVGDRRPPDEPGKSRSEGDATARGPATKTDFKEVQRTVGVPRVSVSVRYAK